MRKSAGGIAMCLAAMALGHDGEQLDTRQLYEVTTSLDMPHLEDNLRYAITHSQQCLTPTELRRLFPVLQHPALAGCHLGPEVSDTDGVTAELACEGHRDTRGSMHWQEQRPRNGGCCGSGWAART